MIQEKDYPEPYLTRRHREGIVMNMHKPFLCQQARLVSEVLGFASVLLIAGAVRHAAGRTAGAMAGALLATSYVWVMWNRAALLETAMVVPMTAALYACARAERTAEQRLGLLVTVNVGSIEEVDAVLQRRTHHGIGRCRVDASAEVVAADADCRDVETRRTQAPLFHHRTPRKPTVASWYRIEPATGERDGRRCGSGL
jgi:hypothetical protein